MITLITVVHVVACVFLILTVLLQAGKGGGVGVALGGQTSAQVFGGRGAGSFLERLTAGTAVVFMITSMSLAYNATQVDSKGLSQKSKDLAAAKKKLDEQKAADDKATKDAEDRAKKDATKTEVTTPTPASEDTTATPAPKTDAPAPKADAPAPKAAKPAAPAPAPVQKPADEEQQ
jgi:preprotein translocase subunit SecG